MMRFFVIVCAILLSVLKISAGEVFELDGKYGYNGYYTTGRTVTWILDLPLYDSMHKVNYTIPANYDNIIPLCYFDGDEYVMVERGGKKGIYKNGHEYSSIGKYDDIIPIEKKYKYNPERTNRYAIVLKNGKYGAIVPKVPVIYDKIEFVLDADKIITTKNGKQGLFQNGNSINTERLLPEEYDKIEVKAYNRILLQKNGKFGLFLYKGKMTPIEYDYFDAETGIVSKNNLYGMYETHFFSDYALPIEYQLIKPIEHKYYKYLVKKNNKYGIIEVSDEGATVKTIFPLEYDSIEPEHYIIKQNGKYGKCNSKGKVVLPAEYDKITLYDEPSGHYMIFEVRKGNKIGFIRVDSDYDENVKIMVPLAD